MRTLLFYDIETSGLNPAFDQILTFAAIRTDLQLNELDRQAVTVQFREDIIPSPMAFMTHGLTFDELKSGVSEYEAALAIHEMVNVPGTISLGYNSLGFDDEFLRFLFYRNLLDPYSHQYSRGCGRMDILPVTAIYRLFNPQRLSWPKIDGKDTLKLEHISRENGFETSGRAHEAMNDVEALIELCKIFIKDIDIWTYSLDFFNKTKDEIRINNIKPDIEIQNRRFRVCVMVSPLFGPDNHYLAPVLHLGPSKPYKNQSLWLRLDNTNLLGLESGKEISETMVIRKRSADALIVLPPLERFWNRLPIRSREETDRNLKLINEQWAVFFELIQYHSEFKYPIIPEMDTDASLYQDGFFTGEEKQEIRKFHNALSNGNYNTIETIGSARIKRLAHRILYRNFSRSLSPELSDGYASYLARLKSDAPEDLFIGFRNDVKLNTTAAKEELKQIGQSLSHPTELEKRMMIQLEKYFSGL